MNWTNAGDILFLVGELLAAGLCVYGGWLSITAPGVRRYNATDDGRPRAATPEAELLARRPRDAARRERGIEACDDFINVPGSN